MLEEILAQMNEGLQPEDKPYAIEDAEQHVCDYSAWVDGRLQTEPTEKPSGVKPILKAAQPQGEMSTARKFAYSQLITSKLEEALELAQECAGELEAEYDSLPHHREKHGEYEFNDPDRAKAVDRQRQDAIEIETQIQNLLSGSDDWFIVGWSHRFFYPTPDEVAKEKDAIESEMDNSRQSC